MNEQRTLTDQAYLAAIVESSDDAILSKNSEGIIQSCNPATERIFGYKPDELIGRPVRILIPRERQAEEDEILRRIRAGKRVDHFETERVRKDGRVIDVSLTISPVRGPSGEVIGASKIARDITEQKRIARELEAQREWLDVTLGSIDDGVIASDANGCITYMNGSAAALTGWAPPEAAGRALAAVFQVINERTRERVQDPAELVMRSGRIVGLANHSVLIDRDGGEHPIADSAAPIRDAAGAIIGVVLVFRDVTEQRRAEEAIAEQREWLETTLASIGDAVIATDEHAKVVFMNPIAEHLTGWSIDQARGRPCTEVFDIVNEDTRRTVENPATRVLKEGIIVGLANHTTLISLDGTERPIDDSGAPIRDKNGRTIGAVLVFRDIGDRRKAEAERRDAAVERERLLTAERTARADAERANRVKDEFIAMVSHELRTPLNAILGWTQLMRQSPTNTGVIERGLDVVSRNTRIQTQLISDLLDMSRIISGKLRLSIEEVDLPALIDNAIEAVHQPARNKGIAIHRELGAMPPIAGDPARLQQVIWNLLLNAIKFTPDGGSVLVRLRSVGGDAEITVADTGIGIRSEVLPHIFERFRQGNPTITRRFGGLGLGLAIAKHFVDLHGGSIRAESAGEGRGATFTIALPASVVTETRGAAGTAHGAQDAGQGADPLKGMRILVVEDENDTLDFVRRFLESYGADVVTARSAIDALALVPDSRFDFLVSDIGLPDMDGYELLQRIRRLDVSAAGGMPAIALTAYVRAEDRKAAFQAGYQAHLGKPVEPNELLETIANLARGTASEEGPSG
jgi:PAS domain S-box-containing protein